MSPDQKFVPSLDGILPPAPEPLPEPAKSPESQQPTPPKKKPILSGSVLLFIGLAIAYILPALFLVAIFPTPDASLANVKIAGIVFYGLGAMVWLCIGFIAFLRIANFKDKPRMQTNAMLRLFLIELPLIVISAGTVFLISQEPALRLDIVSPEEKDLVAPITVTFGTTSASAILKQQKLTPLKYQWDFNNDGIIDQDNFDSQATFFYRLKGDYVPSVRVTMTSGVVKKISLRLTIKKDSFAVEPSPVIIDEPVNFSVAHLFVKKEDLKNAQWDLDGDGNTDATGTALETSFTYRRLGTVSPTVTLSLANQTQLKLSRTFSVVDAPKPPFPVTLESNPTTLLGPPPFPVMFTIKTDEPIANFSWTFGDNKNGEGKVVEHVYREVGNYTATAFIRSQSGTVAKLTKLVRVTTPLSINDLTFEGKPAVQGDTITGEVPLTLDLTPATSQPLISFQWDAPDASEVISSDTRLQAIYRKEGKYKIELIAHDTDYKVLRKVITVNVQPASSVVSFSMDPLTPEAPASVKFDASDTFIRPGEDVTGFVWDFGDGNSGNNFSGSRIEHFYDKPGTYNISLTVQTTSGNTYNARKTLIVRAPLKRACFVPSRTTGKAPLSVRFDTTCTTGAFNSWLWDFGDNSQSDLQNPEPHVFKDPGEYVVLFSATTKDGTKDTFRSVISVSP